jgi:hypothetical protein
VARKALVDRLEAALELRHFVVHGVWVNGSFVEHPHAGEPFDFVSMKRRYRTEAPENDTKAKAALKWLACDFWEIEDELDGSTPRCSYAPRVPTPAAGHPVHAGRSLWAP